MTQGYILNLPGDRASLFEDSVNGRFAEPVPNFSHNRGYPLIVFISADEEKITHLALGKAGLSAGTNLRRLNLDEIRQLKTQLGFEQLLRHVPKGLRHHINNTLDIGGLLPPKSFQALITAIREIDPALDSLLSRFDERRYESIGKLSQLARKSLAEQKEAINTAFQLAEINRNPLREWTPSAVSQTASFLDGLPSVYTLEDSMIFNDLSKFPGFEHIQTFVTGRARFEDGRTRLDILNANRTGLEKLTGTDLIYYNATYKSFVMVQYKAMEQSAGKKAHYRLPNSQLAEEIIRMNSIFAHIEANPSPQDRHEYRFINNPFFIKLCPRIILDPDSVELTPGMYFTLDHWRFLESDGDLIGTKGGRTINYLNVGRHLTNTDFTNLVRSSWVGTTPNQSSMLEPIIASILESGKGLMLAVKSEIIEGFDIGSALVDEEEKESPFDEDDVPF